MLALWLNRRESKAMIKKSLVYIKNGSVIRIDDTLLNRIKARMRGFKIVRKADWDVDLRKSQDGK